MHLIRLFGAALSLVFVTTVSAQNVIVFSPPVLTAPAPVVSTPVVVQRPVVAAPTVTAPVVSARPALTAPVFSTPVVAARPVITSVPVATSYNVYAPPVIVRPKVYVPGQPVRNFFRAVTP